MNKENMSSHFWLKNTQKHNSQDLTKIITYDKELILNTNIFSFEKKKSHPNPMNSYGN